MTQSPLSPCRRGGGSAPIVPLQTLLEGGLKPIAPSRRSWRGELSFHGPPADAPGRRWTQPHCPPADGGNSAPIVPLQTSLWGELSPYCPPADAPEGGEISLHCPLQTGGLSPHCPPADGGTQPPLSPCRRSWREGGSALIVPLQTGEGGLSPHRPPADAPGGRGAQPSLSTCRRGRGTQPLLSPSRPSVR